MILCIDTSITILCKHQDHHADTTHVVVFIVSQLQVASHDICIENSFSNFNAEGLYQHYQKQSYHILYMHLIVLIDVHTHTRNCAHCNQLYDQVGQGVNTKSSTLRLVLEAGDTSHLLSEDYFFVSEDPVSPLSLSSLAFCSA